MTKLSDTQLLLLASAAKRDDGGVILPDRLTGGARENVVNRLLALQLIERVEPAPGSPRPLGCEEPLVTLRITDAGLAAIGVETGDGEGHQEDGSAETSIEAEATDEPAETSDGGTGLEKVPEPAAPASVPQRSAKLGIVLDLLGRPEGASLDEIMAATGWQRHSVRGAIAGTVKRKLGHAVVSERRDGIHSYRIEA